MKILKLESLDRLRIHLLNNPMDILLDYEALSEKLKLSLVNLELDLNFEELEPLTGTRKQEVSEELPNVLKVRAFFGELSPLIALDERFWVSITLSHYKEYFLDRWFDKEAAPEVATRVLDNHLFAASSRRFIRDQAVSRLWWAGKVASGLDSVPLDSALDVMFWNSDLLSQITSRPSTASSSALTGAVIQYMLDFKKSGKSFDRKRFRRLMAELDLLMGRSLLFSLSQKALKSRVETIATEVFAE